MHRAGWKQSIYLMAPGNTS